MGGAVPRAGGALCMRPPKRDELISPPAGVQIDRRVLRHLPTTSCCSARSPPPGPAAPGPSARGGRRSPHRPPAAGRAGGTAPGGAPAGRADRPAPTSRTRSTSAHSTSCAGRSPCPLRAIASGVITTRRRPSAGRGRRRGAQSAARASRRMAREGAGAQLGAPSTPAPGCPAPGRRCRSRAPRGPEGALHQGRGSPCRGRRRRYRRGPQALEGENPGVVPIYPGGPDGVQPYQVDRPQLVLLGRRRSTNCSCPGTPISPRTRRRDSASAGRRTRGALLPVRPAHLQAFPWRCRSGCRPAHRPRPRRVASPQSPQSWPERRCPPRHPSG